MRGDDGGPDEQPGDDERSDGGEEEGEHGRDDEAEQRLAVGEGAAEEHDGLVGGPEGVEEAPGAEEGEEGEEGEGVRQERGQGSKGAGVAAAEAMAPAACRLPPASVRGARRNRFGGLAVGSISIRKGVSFKLEQIGGSMPAK